MDFATLIQILDSSVRLATPLLLACLAGLFSERAGVFDIGLEGKMLVSAFFSAAIAATTGSVWLGLGAGVLAAMAFSLIHGVASITFRGDQLISGVAINFLASGLTVLIAQDWFSQGGRTPPLSGAARFSDIEWPGAGMIRDVPVLGAGSTPTWCRATRCWSTWRLWRCRSRGGCSTGPASGSACARWARTPARWTLRASRWCGCATRRC